MRELFEDLYSPIEPIVSLMCACTYDMLRTRNTYSLRAREKYVKCLRTKYTDRPYSLRPDVKKDYMFEVNTNYRIYS